MPGYLAGDVPKLRGIVRFPPFTGPSDVLFRAVLFLVRERIAVRTSGRSSSLLLASLSFEMSMTSSGVSRARDAGLFDDEADAEDPPTEDGGRLVGLCPDCEALCCIAEWEPFKEDLDLGAGRVGIASLPSRVVGLFTESETDE